MLVAFEEYIIKKFIYGIFSLCDQPLPMNIEKLTMNQTSVTDTGLTLIATSMKTLRSVVVLSFLVNNRGIYYGYTSIDSMNILI